jgi:hypothetical protein
VSGKFSRWNFKGGRGCFTLSWEERAGVRTSFSNAPALILAFYPREKEQPSLASWFADECPASSVAGIFKVAADVSPSPSRRGPR